MAIIQMVNDQVHDVTETGSEVEAAIREAAKYPVPMLKLEITEDHGGGPIWINANAIGSFVSARDSRPATETKDHPWR